MEPRPEGTSYAASPSTRQLLVVAGSGRSGTSLFTGLVGRLGLHIPKPEVKANVSNPRGFGEPRWVVDFHNELLKSVDVTVEDGRPEAWELTDGLAVDDDVRGELQSWLEKQFAEADRIVVKDPRLAWFIKLYGVIARDLRADLRVATMLRHPAEVMRSREVAYGTRTSNTTRVIGWVNMMLGIEARTRDLARATVRYDDLLADWSGTIARADQTLGLDLLVDPARVASADDLVDPSLRRSMAQWSELSLPSTTRHLAERVFDTYGRLVGSATEDQGPVRDDLDDLAAEFVAYYDECFEVSRSRAGARARQERRKAMRRVRSEQDADAPRPEMRVATATSHVTRFAAAVRRRLDGFGRGEA